MAHVWNDRYGTLYDRTYQVLYNAGVDEKLADQLATRRTLAAALRRASNRSQVSFTAASARTTRGHSTHRPPNATARKTAFVRAVFR